MNTFWETNTLTNFLAVLSLVLSFIAAMTSLYYSRKGYEQTSKLNEINIELDYYKKIFDEYVMWKIPKARRRLRLSSENKLIVDSCVEMEKVLINLLNDIYFFSFRNKKLYEELKNIILALDEYIVENRETIFNIDNSKIFFDVIDDNINNLYSKFFNSVLGY